MQPNLWDYCPGSMKYTTMIEKTDLEK